MDRIIVAGDTPEQYMEQLSTSPDSFRPANCLGCSKEGLWRHGFYLRYPDRATADHKALNPIPILRFQVSSLLQDMLMSADVSCAKALAFMVDSANDFIACFVRHADQPYQQRASAIAAYDWTLESMVATDA